jgi:Mrp family chromosome partitioning ATPase
VGVDTLLTGRAKIDEARVRLDRPALDVFPVLSARRAAHEYLVGPRFAGLISDLESRYAVVIIDTPPTLLLPDSTLILRQGACCAAVARIGQTRVRRYQELLDLLPSSQIIGKILNGATPPRHRRDNYYYYEGSD